jgi:MFS transporter, putative metabolite:H+ symporter
MSGGASAGSAAGGPAPVFEPFSPYQRRLFAFLSVASFFEGYDFFALTQILPNLRADLGITPRAGTWLVSFINFGTILAYWIASRGDRWGRKRVLTLTIAGYTLFTFLSGLSPNVWAFAVFQMLARIFLIGEWVTSMVIAAEEYPAARRGTVIGIVSAAAGLGSIVCAIVVPSLLATAYGWRSVYFVGIVPLLVLAFARRGLRETRRFSERSELSKSLPLSAIWRSAHRRRLIELSLIWFLTYVCIQNAVTFWKEFAIAERGLSNADVGRAVAIAAVGAMPIAFFAGKVLDVIGRKLGAALIYGCVCVGIAGAYTLHGVWPLTVALMVGVIGINCVLTVLNAFTTELFPTEFRSSAFAWSNNLLGRIGYWLSPLAIGELQVHWGWGASLRLTVIFPFLALLLVLWLLPETRGRELEDTARVERVA